jgi:hypothetical protein
MVPDATHPRMWRIAWPGGHLSDIVNLARAKDAAAAIAERGPPARDRRLIHWKQEPSRTPSGPHPSREMTPTSLKAAEESEREIIRKSVEGMNR